MSNIVDGTSALKITFDGLEWDETQEVKDYCKKRLMKNVALETFKRIDRLPFNNVSIRFTDNVWDFSHTVQNRDRDGMIFYFDAESPYCDYLKLFVLNDILKRRTKIRTVNNKVSLIRPVLNKFASDGYVDFMTVPKSEFQKYYSELEKHIGYYSVCSYKSAMKLFIEFYEHNVEPLSDPTVKKFIAEIDTARRNREKEANKTPEIPPEYLAILVPAYQKIMADTNEENDDRIMAACLLLYSQIGFRTGELLAVEADAIEEETLIADRTPLRYLTYKSFKHAKGDDGYTIGRAFLNDIAYEAYQTLMTLCQSRREQIGANTLVVFGKQKARTYKVGSFSTKYRIFVLRHAAKLQCINIGEQYHGMMTTDSVRSYFEAKDKNGNKKLNINSVCYSGLSIEDTITYPMIRQFRVSVCTYLYRQHVPLHYIRKHMNHLTADMTAYYIRPEQNAERNYSEAIYSAVFKDKAKILGQHGDAFVEKINEYIKTIDPAIKSDIDEVIVSVAEKYPLRSKVGGFCIRCGNVVPCASNNDTDTIFCAFGMCPNHCHMFFMVDIAYKTFKGVLAALRYNEEHGYKKAMQKERNKLDYIVRNSLLPEITELDSEIERKGKDDLVAKYPQLREIVENIERVHEEIEQWI